MSGIYGIYQMDGSAADTRVLPRMGDAISHRGPDDHGMHGDGRCAIGIRRLAIVGSSGSRQPIGNEDDSLMVVCDGRIVNAREVRSDLEMRGVRFSTDSDAEVLVHGYAEWGESVLERLSGMYAFAIWDAHAQTLIVGRDRIGIKPLYTAFDGRRFAFASEAKALLEVPGIEAEIDPQALDAFLQLGCVPAPLSMFRGIRKLPAGGTMRLTPTELSTRSISRPAAPTDGSLEPGEWAQRVRVALEESIRRQLADRVPVGAFLAGDVDSTAVVALMNHLGAPPVHTYSIGFDGGADTAGADELLAARLVAQRFGTQHRQILVRPDLGALLPRLLWHLDEPIADGAFVATYLAAEFARRDVRVVMSGIGGDALFGGYRRYLDEGRLRALDWLPSAARRGVFRLARLSKTSGSFFGAADLPLEDRYRNYVGTFSPVEVDALTITPSLRPFDGVAAAFAGAESDDPVACLLAVDFATQVPDRLLMLTDKMTMAASIECRVPMLDQHLVELVQRIPAQVKVRRGQSKPLLKSAVADLLPAEVLHREKRGVDASPRAWLEAALAPLITSALSRKTVESRGLLHYEPIAELVAAHRGGRINASGRLLALLTLEVWCRVYLDRRSAADVGDQLMGLAA